MNKSVKKESDIKAGIGIGGFLCTCCNPWFYTRKHGKAIVSRILRRKAKQELQKEESDK